MTTRTRLMLIWIALALASRATGLRQKIARNATGVRLGDGSIMEIVEERTCSAALVRLTCRSLTSFIFILQAQYQPNQTDRCEYDKDSWCRYKSLAATIHNLQLRRQYLLGDYARDLDKDPLDFRNTLSRRCSGHHHCRYRVMSDHPEALFWMPANVRIKYACIPEVSVYKYCNADVKVPGGVGGYLKSPGYPLYYVGGITCGWTLRSFPGQRIVLTFHDLSIREHERDGSCVDVVRVRDNGNTLFETCGSVSGVKIISNTNVVTLNLIASLRLYPARGFLLQYQAVSEATKIHIPPPPRKVLGCPDVTAPLGSYVSNGSLETRTFLCRAGTLFPDTGQRTRTVHCRDGRWEESIPDLPACAASTSKATLILRNDIDDPSRLPIGSETHGSSSTGGVLDKLPSIEKDTLDNVIAKVTNNTNMDQTRPSISKDDGNYVVDFILPTLLIALLFLGNAVIVYVIFQYRKRNVDDDFRKIPAARREEIALGTANGEPQV